jgi:hypothetical protein
MLPAMVVAAALLVSAGIVAFQMREDRLQRQCLAFLGVFGNSQEDYLAAVSTGNPRATAMGAFAAGTLHLNEAHRKFCEFPRYNIFDHIPKSPRQSSP